MATSNFSAFGLGAGAFVYTPAAWAANPVRSSGFPPGLLLKEQLNTPIRQASSIATMVANFIAANQAADVQDNGDLVTLLAQFQSAIASFVGSNASGYTLGSSAGGATNRVVQLVPGTWQMILQLFLYREDGGNFDNTPSQQASVVGSLTNMNATASGRMYRIGSSGHGRVVGVAVTAMNSMVVAASGSFTMSINAVTGLGDIQCRGSILTLERIG
jgi:hypothetical protein